MIDLTPLDVRKKRGDIAKVLRGYDPEEVDTFLEIVAERLEDLVKENMTLKERSERLGEQVRSLETREHAVHEALVTAQELSGEIGEQARRESLLLRREAEAEAGRIRHAAEEYAERVLREAEAMLEERKAALRELDRKRERFLRSLRTLLERELDGVSVAEDEVSMTAQDLDLDLSDWRERLADIRASAPEATLPEMEPAPELPAVEGGEGVNEPVEIAPLLPEPELEAPSESDHEARPLAGRPWAVEADEPAVQEAADPEVDAPPDPVELPAAPPEEPEEAVPTAIPMAFDGEPGPPPPEPPPALEVEAEAAPTATDETPPLATEPAMEDPRVAPTSGDDARPTPEEDAPEESPDGPQPWDPEYEIPYPEGPTEGAPAEAAVPEEEVPPGLDRENPAEDTLWLSGLLEPDENREGDA